MHICMGCMERAEDTVRLCPRCGYVRGTPAKEVYHLQPESILAGRYIVGRVLGYGGFGVTYLGWDAQLERKVAIKEYLPSDFATRMPGDVNLTVYANEAAEQFEAGLKSFVAESQRLAKFNSKPGIVDIYNSFTQNYTAYIVMQFLDGSTVKELMQQQGVFPFERAKEIILAVLQSLQEVHKEGIIHRDVSPDNIFITKDGEIKLLDFGAARYATTFHSKSLSVILKPGYAPEEQYRSRGNQGPWTDVYATAATFYKMITGVTPDEAMERAMKDSVAEPGKLGAVLPKSAENAIMNAMNVKMEDRTQSAADFYKELVGNEVERKKATLQRYDAGKTPGWLKAVVAALAVTVIGGGVYLGYALIGNSRIDGKTAGTPAGMVNVPLVVNKTMEEAQQELEQLNLQYEIIGAGYNEKVPENKVFEQKPAAGTVIEYGATVQVTVSRGVEKPTVPDVCDKMQDDARKELEALGFRVQIETDYSDTAPGAVVSQSVPADTGLDKNSIIILTVSEGIEGLPMGTQITVPNIVGLKLETAKSFLSKQGLYIVIRMEEKSAEHPKGSIIYQGVAQGNTMLSGESLDVIVSLGPDQVKMPNVVNMSLNDAQAELDAINLKCTVDYAAKTGYAAGVVLEQSIRKGATVDEGTKITLTVQEQAASASSGNSGGSGGSTGGSGSNSGRSSGTTSSAPVTNTVTVPYVVGMERFMASTTLQGHGFRVSTQEAFSDNYDEGTVMSQSPSGGQLKEGGTIAITISKGREPKSGSISVPDMVGKKEDSAIRMLEDLGAEYEIYYMDAYDEDNYDIVMEQTPGAGAVVSGDTVICIWVGE